jgi:23S rRNA pseudouridine2605 synthase
MTSLSKFLAQSGVSSRRKVVELIKLGYVSINGITITEPGYKLAEDAHVSVHGRQIKQEKKLYILLNKPKDYICTVKDERDRKTVLELLPKNLQARVYPVGRLDRNTTGLLLLTNDGELAQRLSHPRYETNKDYHITLDRPLTQKDFVALKNGVMLEDGFTKVDAIKRQGSQVLVALHSGKNRIVRRLFERFDYKVLRLDRISYAGLSKRDLKVGMWRYLTREELLAL